jgi:uncharacterized membrane protein HdeD (DUF308 family)
MAQKAIPMWARILEIVAGIIVLLLAVYVILNPNIAIDLLRLILGIGLIILGLVLLIRGATSQILSTAGKILNVILGLIVLALGVAAIVYVNFGTAFLILLFAIGLLLNAVGRISFAGYSMGAVPSWVRWGSIILGIIAVILAIAVIVFPGISQAILVFLVALVFLLFGIQLILTGAGSRGGS